MNIFSLNDSRDLVSSLIEEKFGRGGKSKLAEALSCQPGYISQVLGKGKIHFSAENVMVIAQFFHLSETETDYLISLHQLERAGSKSLEKFWKQKVQKIQTENLQVETQIKKLTTDLSDEARGVYYSHWAYCAVHMIVSVQKYATKNAIQERLKLNSNFVEGILSFLLKEALIKFEAGKYSIGKTRIHLKKHDPHVKSLHQNFRNKAIASLENENDFDLHYSVALTLSHIDAFKIRTMILDFLKAKEEILIPSENEELVFLNIDYFK